MALIFLALITCLVVVTLVYLIQKYLRLPWMFTVVILGMVLSALGLFNDTMASANFHFLVRMGMLFFLFMIGLDPEIKQNKDFVEYVLSG